jgi:hypothetical protein
MNTPEEPQKLTQVVAALRQGDNAHARRLIISILKDNPRSEQAWAWACQVATTQEERIHCLRQLLEINPNHDGARRYLEQLQAERSTAGTDTAAVESSPSTKDAVPGPGIINLLLAPLGCLLQVSPFYLLAGLLALLLVGGYIYYNSNSDFLGLAGPDFGSLTFSETGEQIEAGDLYWKVIFERAGDSEFSGLVRHASPIRVDRMRVLTHDILVTSGEYADPSIVQTSVANHRFYWRSISTARPEGSINLLHTVPADEAVYRQLLQVRSGDDVTIIGREILRLEAFDKDGEYLGEWHDTGCNTLLVNSVSITR